jgi:hypothetical protein
LQAIKWGSLQFATMRTLQMINGMKFATGMEFADPLGWADPHSRATAGGGVNRGKRK